MVLKQFFYAGWQLNNSGDKISSIAEKSGYPQGPGGLKNAPKMTKIENAKKIMKKNEKKRKIMDIFGRKLLIIILTFVYNQNLTFKRAYWLLRACESTKITQN